MKKKLFVLIITVMTIMAGCSEADVVSENISKSSD